MDKNIIIRLEEDKDRIAVEELTREAFYNLYVPGCDEHYLVHIMRDHPDFMPELAFVAELDGRIVGNIMYTHSHLEGENETRIETLSFGPLCVHPDFQREGIGTALIEHTKALAIAKGYPAILILGDPHNYVKHGFKNGRDCNIAYTDGSFPLGLLALEIKEGFFNTLREQKTPWRLCQSPVYSFDPKESEAWDATLPPKEKKWKFSQELFSMQIRATVGGVNPFLAEE